MELSSSEENYLKSIFKISEQKGTPVATNTIAKDLSTSAASVTDMLKKLAAKDMVQYEKYHGAHLSAEGNRRATQLIRRHRLWETFLVEKLDFTWGEVHDLAEQLEHIKSEKLVNRLDAYLSYPRFDPHGDPIPDREGKFTFRKQQLLETLEIGDEGVVVSVQNHASEFLDYLAEFSLSLGTKIKVVEKLDFNGAMKVEINHKKPIVISPSISQNVNVKKV